MMKARYAIPVILLAGSAAFANSAMASDELAGALLGGATGAVIGHAIGGHEGAVAGGAFGAVLGAVAGSDRYDEGVYYGPPPPVVYEEPRVVYGPPAVYVQSPPRYYGNYGHPGIWRGHDGRWDHDHDGRWDHRGR